MVNSSNFDFYFSAGASLQQVADSESVRQRFCGGDIRDEKLYECSLSSLICHTTAEGRKNRTEIVEKFPKLRFSSRQMVEADARLEPYQLILSFEAESWHTTRNEDS